MKIVPASFEILAGLDPWTLQNIEKYGRVCYKSEGRIAKGTAEIFAKSLIDRQHESVIEHEVVTVRIICDRGISHEIVRNRIASYSQESTRYCNYSKECFGREITVVQPPGLGMAEYRHWVEAMSTCERCYFALLDLGVKPQIARGVLPTNLKTEIIMTLNLRSWRNFFKQRTAKGAHPQMREIAVPLLKQFQASVAVLFDDIKVEEA